MTCGACGGQIPEGSTFCAACGARQGAVPPPLRAGWDEAVRQAPPAPGRASSSRWIWILLGVGAVVVLALVGLGAAALNLGLSVLDEQVRVELRDNPVLQRYVGEPEPFELDFVGTAADPGQDVFVFKVRGPLGSGRISANCVTDEEGRERVTAGKLRLDSGAEYDLFPEGEAEAEAEP